MDIIKSAQSVQDSLSKNLLPALMKIDREGVILNGTVMNIVDSLDSTRESIVTEHWLEDGTVVTDSVVIRPKTIEMKIVLAEKMFYEKETTIDTALNVVNKIKPPFINLPATPALADAIKATTIAVGLAKQVMNSVGNLADIIKGKGASEYKIEQTLKTLMAIQNTKQIVSIITRFETVYGILTKITYSKSSSALDKIDVSLSFKEINIYGEIQTVAVDPSESAQLVDRPAQKGVGASIASQTFNIGEVMKGIN